MQVENLRINETFINATENYMFGDSQPYEPFTNDTGELYRALRAEYGRCTGKRYVDLPSGTKAIGWVFEKVIKYDDSNETYKREVIVTLLRDTGSGFDNLKYDYVYLN